MPSYSIDAVTKAVFNTILNSILIGNQIALSEYIFVLYFGRTRNSLNNQLLNFQKLFYIFRKSIFHISNHGVHSLKIFVVFYWFGDICRWPIRSVYSTNNADYLSGVGIDTYNTQSCCYWFINFILIISFLSRIIVVRRSFFAVGSY